MLALQAALFQAQLELQVGQRAQRRAARTQQDLQGALQRLEADLRGALQHRRDTQRHNQVRREGGPRARDTCTPCRREAGPAFTAVSLPVHGGFTFCLRLCHFLFAAVSLPGPVSGLQELVLVLEKVRSALLEREERLSEAELQRRRRGEEQEAAVRQLRTSLLTRDQLIQVRPGLPRQPAQPRVVS